MPSTSATLGCRRRITSDSGDLALFERLERDLNAAGVERGVDVVDADEGGDIVDGGVLKDDVDEPLLALEPCWRSSRSEAPR